MQFVCPFQSTVFGAAVQHKLAYSKPIAIGARFQQTQSHNAKVQARKVEANLFKFLFGGGQKTSSREDEIVEELLDMCESQPAASLGFGTGKKNRVIELVTELGKYGSQAPARGPQLFGTYKTIFLSKQIRTLRGPVGALFANKEYYLAFAKPDNYAAIVSFKFGGIVDGYAVVKCKFSRKSGTMLEVAPYELVVKQFGSPNVTEVPEEPFPLEILYSGPKMTVVYRNTEFYENQYCIFIPLDPSELQLDLFGDTMTGTQVVINPKAKTKKAAVEDEEEEEQTVVKKAPRRGRQVAQESNGADQAQKQVDGFKSAQDQAKGQVRALSDEVRGARSAGTKAKSDLMKAEAGAKAAEAKVEELQSKLQALVEEQEQAQTQLMDARVSIRDLEAKLAVKK